MQQLPKAHSRTEYKLFLFVLTVLVGTGLIFGIYQIYNNIYGPLRVEGDVMTLSEIKELDQWRSLQYFMSLQKQDTDGDGLNDYDEIYTYQTSPFLKDSDSDDLDDRLELEQGGDPLCHKDKDCSGQNFISPSPLGDLEESVPEDLEKLLSPLDMNLATPPTDFTPADIRALLLQSGFTAEQVNAFSDEELMDTWHSITEDLE